MFLTLATLGIGLAGVAMAAWESGGAGVRSLLGQILRWRVRPIWYVAAVLVPALFPAGAFLLGLALGNPPTPTASPSPSPSPKPTREEKNEPKKEKKKESKFGSFVRKVRRIFKK